VTQATLGERRRAIDRKGVDENVQFSEKRVDVTIGRGRAERVPRRLDAVERLRSSRQAGVDAGHGAPIELVLTLRRPVRRRFDHATGRLGDLHDAVVQRQFRAQLSPAAQASRDCSPLSFGVLGRWGHGHQRPNQPQ
jgi:hypothetical protein